MITNKLHSFLRRRMTPVMTVVICVSLAEQAAFAQKAVFERKNPHVNVGTIGRLQPLPDPLLTGGDAMERESPCPCQNETGDLTDDAGAPFELLILLRPRLARISH